MTDTTIEPATPQDVAAFCTALQGFNRPHAGDIDVVAINLCARDGEGNRVGGVAAELALGWLEILVLWVDPDARCRGIGAALLEACEGRAIALGAHAARLDTFDWQAESFYAEHGYAGFARLEDYPPGHERIFMRKHLRDRTAEGR